MVTAWLIKHAELILVVLTVISLVVGVCYYVGDKVDEAESRLEQQIEELSKGQSETNAQIAALFAYLQAKYGDKIN